MSAFKSALLVCLVAVVVEAKIYDKCELAQALKNNGVPNEQIGTWVCIANYESGFDTQAVNPINEDGSSDHGIFQINDEYWCSPPNIGTGCGVSCDELMTDNLDVAIKCIQTVYEETQRLKGDGFMGWTVYSQQMHCRTQDETNSWIDGCGI